MNITFHKLTEIYYLSLLTRYYDNKGTAKIDSLRSSNKEKSEKYNVSFQRRENFVLAILFMADRAVSFIII